MKVVYRVGKRVEEVVATSNIIFSKKWIEFFSCEGYRYSVPVDCVIGICKEG